MTGRIVTINGGSSSIKFALYAAGDSATRLVSGEIERIGLADATLRATGPGVGPDVRQPLGACDHEQAANRLIDWLLQCGELAAVVAVGHRIVHGGPRYTDSQRVTPDVVDELKRIERLDPEHLPHEIALVEAFARQLPGLPQIVCFDTAFHRDLPRVARLLPVPRRYEAEGVRRYGFHGLSFAFLMGELARVAGADASRGRIILAHLGAGASLAAVRDGKSIDTTMGFTPTAGLVMATRSGDLDPGLITYLMRREHMTVDQLDELVNHRSGLLGVSETSSDMRDLLARQGADSRAAEAVALFCYQAKKWIGAMAAALGGVDTLVFAGGIGENAPFVRARICDGLDWLGISLDENRNAANEAVISAAGGRTTVRMIHTDEQVMIAREVQRLLADRLEPRQA